MQTLGGHFYDSAELAFFCGAVLLAIQGRLLALVLLTSFATLNKESFLFFLPALYPFLREKLDRKNTLAGLALAILVSGLLNAYVKFIFHQNPGDVAEIHFWENLKEYLLPWTYMRIEWTYGLPSPEGANLATLVFIFIIVVRGISQISPAMKSHLLIAISINFPLFLVFCQTGELRNLSMMFVGFVVLMAGALKTVKSD
ncbi:MAG: hypothetical protein PHD43_24035 [Methylococcales bacterium]|nr:hypothetical protein [Methylococcales bacterium]